jgi:excisionase family DNA binding protein
MKVMTTSEVMSTLRLSRATVAKRVRDGTLPAVQIGKVFRFPADPIERLARGEQPETESKQEG